MATSLMQHSLAAGELAPSMFARTDLAKYHAGAALLRNFFVDYRGGASTRFGTKYSLRAKVSSAPVRLIPFQASFTVGYALEFGQNYIRFHANGNPVLEAGTAITGITQANPAVVTDNAHGYANGDWVFLQNVGGMTQVNGRYFIVAGATANTYQLTDLDGNNVNSTGYGAYTAGGTAQRVYTIQSPFVGTDLALVKYAQSTNLLVLCHPSYPAQILTFNSATNWTITAINFNPTIGSPTGLAVVFNGGAGAATSYLYSVTAVDQNGQESVAAQVSATGAVDISGATKGVARVSWTAVPGAQFYNVYKAVYGYGGFGALATGTQTGYIGYCTGTTFTDDAIPPNFAQNPPIAQNPFLGASVTALNLTGNANYTTVPSVTIAAPSSGVQATGYVSLTAYLVGIAAGGNGYAVNDTISLFPGVALRVTSIGGGASVTGVTIVSGGSLTSGNVPPNPVGQISSSGGGIGATFNFTWQIGALVLSQGGSGYTAAPAVTFSAGAATATATIGTQSGGNPTVPCLFQQRLYLAAPTGAPQTLYASVPGAYFDFNVSNPLQADDSITATLVSKSLNTIKSMIPMPSGLLVFTTAGAWIINGGASGTAVTPIDATANAQAYNGANDLPPIVNNYDVLYVQSKGSIIRDLSYNFYANIFTGTDISVLSNHLFYGLSIKEWAFAEEPFKIIWAVRSDGTLLSLTFLKEQEIYGWAHSDTKGTFQSICSITENTAQNGFVDATYFVVQRTIGGNIVQYIERLADRFFNYGIEDTWALDAAVASASINNGFALNTGITVQASAATGAGVTFTFSQSLGFTAGSIGRILRTGGGIATITAVNSGSVVVGTITQPITYITPDDSTNTPLPDANWSLWSAPATTFSGLDHLNGQTVSALADGKVVTGLAVANGSITLPTAATKVIAGLPFTAQFQSLYIDAPGETTQGKRKIIPAVTARVNNTRGLKVGRTFGTLVPIKDSQIPILVPSGLVNADERVVLDPLSDVPGQICLQQDNPWPATILGLIPEVTVGDTAK